MPVVGTLSLQRYCQKIFSALRAFLKRHIASRSLMKPYEALWSSVELRDASWSLTKPNWALWSPVELRKALWSPLEPCGASRSLMKPYRALYTAVWSPEEFYETPGNLMKPYAYARLMKPTPTRCPRPTKPDSISIQHADIGSGPRTYTNILGTPTDYRTTSITFLENWASQF